VEELKPLEQINEPDSRQTRWIIRNEVTGAVRKLTLSEHHSAISRITLRDAVPEDLRDHFVTAKNLLLYSWYVYRFIAVAELHAYATLEFALRRRLGFDNDERPPTLHSLFGMAVAQGLLTDEDFAELRQDPDRPIITGNSFVDGNLWTNGGLADRQHVHVLHQLLPKLRNLLAHGSSSIWPGGLPTLWVIATAINSLFRERI
jgi:hypothetical protein